MSDQLRAPAVLTRCTDSTEVVLSFSFCERCFGGEKTGLSIPQLGTLLTQFPLFIVKAKMRN